MLVDFPCTLTLTRHPVPLLASTWSSFSFSRISTSKSNPSSLSSCSCSVETPRRHRMEQSGPRRDCKSYTATSINERFSLYFHQHLFNEYEMLEKSRNLNLTLWIPILISWWAFRFWRSWASKCTNSNLYFDADQLYASREGGRLQGPMPTLNNF